MNKDERDEEHSEDEESLTPGDLMAFAWQISQAMVCTCMNSKEAIQSIILLRKLTPSYGCILTAVKPVICFENPVT